MATKTFKIGERCKGGIITVEVTKTKVTVIGKEWDHSKGDRKSSDQSGAKEWTRETIDVRQIDAYNKLNDFLCDLTWVGIADQIIKWIETKISITQNLY